MSEHQEESSAPEQPLMAHLLELRDRVLKIIYGIVIAFGLAFETPVAIVLLIRTGFVTPTQLRDSRGYVLVGCFVVAAVLTPPDIASQFMLAVPTYILFEIGIVAGQWLTPDVKEVEEQQQRIAEHK